MAINEIKCAFLYDIALQFGEERRMMTDERTQVINMLESAIQKVKEIEDAKRKEREEDLRVSICTVFH